ncbi:hypothetical protein CWIS_02275 [Cellulomonas sp. A375-1]|uniref:hypothetical protein n=1 Tax=Cellulomonas sp. A375-1 TaxID=1672219 RepID=UPI000652734C|nr:hypothetical protein [Cellulomonas sp. A375-1]KMM46997.1 hypothetical protein CWIS_02275 [Cellulomonas sp. A375-1]
MKSSAVRTAVALAAAATLLLAGCSSDDATTDTTATAGATSSAAATPEATEAPTEAEVLDVTHIQLQTAIDTLGLRGLETKVVDADGNEITPEPETVYLVVGQDPIEGVVPVGTVITLTAEKKA